MRETMTVTPRPFGGYYIPDSLDEYIQECIEAEGGYLMGILITSGTQGKEESMGLDFGLGKSTLLGQLCRMVCYRWDHLIPDSVIGENLTRKWHSTSGR